MMGKWHAFIKQIVIFGIFGAIYYGLEILYDGTSHWGMFVCAGLTGNAASFIIKHYKNLKIIKKAVIITSVILILELISGYILNIYLKLNVWDYSLLPYNLKGQICLSFGLIWFFVFSPLILWLEPTIKWIMFNGKKPPHFIRYYYMMFLDIKDILLLKNMRIKNVLSK